ncbi:unannotated protein [freshwater metagenome]|uniref:Unannotated protein n=1 Tax=freshwater metagenome TaxID=449393 RepID=A0A6J7E2Y5_9ZZZZ
MEILHLDAHPPQVVGEILGHLLCQCRDENSLVLCDSLPNALEDVVNLSFGRFHDDLGIDETRRTDDLFDDAVDNTHLVFAGCCRKINLLTNSVQKLWPFEWSIVESAGKAKTVFDQCSLARRVAFIHGTDLWHGHVRFVNDDDEIVGEIVNQRV